MNALIFVLILNDLTQNVVLPVAAELWDDMGRKTEQPLAILA